MGHGGSRDSDFAGCEMLAKHFQPKPHAAREWARLARHTGQKCMVMTTSATRASADFDSQLTDYCAPQPGAGTDLVREYRRSGASRGSPRGVLLFADGLAPSGWCALRKTDEAARKRFVEYTPWT